MSILTIKDYFIQQLDTLSPEEFIRLSKVSKGLRPWNTKKLLSKTEWITHYEDRETELVRFAGLFDELVDQSSEYFPEVSKRVILKEFEEAIREKQVQAGAKQNFDLKKLACMQTYARLSALAA